MSVTAKQKPAQPLIQPTAAVAEPCAMVIFGATGDLTARKLVPALYNLRTATLLNDRFVVVGIGRRDYTDDAFRQEIANALDKFATDDLDPARRKWLLENRRRQWSFEFSRRRPNRKR